MDAVVRHRLARAAAAATERAGGAASRSAHRDLDAVLALFDEAARVEGHRGHTGWSRSSPRSRPSRSPQTRWPSEASVATPYAC